jgi:MFS family permease
VYTRIRPRRNRPRPAPAFIGYFFVGLASGLILLGWTAAICTAISGRCIQKRTKWRFGFVVGAILCAFMPFGTVLGVFTLILLNKDSVKELYVKAA